MTQVEEWLESRRREPTIKGSVHTWLAAHPKGGKVVIGRRPRAGKRQRTIATYLPDEMIREIQADANRHGRSLAESIHEAWKIARPTIQNYPGAP